MCIEEYRYVSPRVTFNFSWHAHHSANVWRMRVTNWSTTPHFHIYLYNCSKILYQLVRMELEPFKKTRNWKRALTSLSTLNDGTIQPHLGDMIKLVKFQSINQSIKVMTNAGSAEPLFQSKSKQSKGERTQAEASMPLKYIKYMCTWVQKK